MLRSWEAISQASSSAWSCCVITERHRSRRRAIFCGVPFVSGIGGVSPPGRSATCQPGALGLPLHVGERGGRPAGELARLELVRDRGPPQVGPASDFLRRALRLRDRRDLAPGQVANLPLGALGQLVEAEDARVWGWILVLLLDYLLRRHRGRLSCCRGRERGTGYTGDSAFSGGG